MHLLTMAIFIPALTALVALFIPGSMKNLIRGICLLGAIATLAVSTQIVCVYNDDEVKKNTSVAAVFETRETEIISHFGLDEARGGAIRKMAATAGGGASLLGNEKAAYEEIRELRIALEGNEIAEHIRLVEFGSWIRSFRINYFLGVDGLSIPLIWLTALLTVLCLVYSWTIDRGVKGFYILFLLLEMGIIGVFCALDFFLFYVFWEIVLLPMYFLIGIWGGPNRIYAAIKFFIYTLVGSVLMLIALLYCYFSTGVGEPYTFNMLALMSTVPALTLGIQNWIFIAFFIGFAIKVPVFPFHTWLPDAHVQAPTAASVVLAGVLLKLGGYGFFRILYPMLPNAASSPEFLWLIAILGVINIVYGALCAMAQTDFKSLVAYSSVSHMGFILLGMASLTVGGITGGVLQMFNHGITSGMMFFLVGIVYDRAHHRDLNDFGGIGLQMPYYTGLAIVGFFSGMGLPGLNGFISEALVFLGAYDSASTIWTHTSPWLVYISLTGIILTAGYILWTVQRVYLGETPDKYKSFPDINLRELISVLPLGVLCLVFGIWPRLILDFMDPSLQAITNTVRATLGQ